MCFRSAIAPDRRGSQGPRPGTPDLRKALWAGAASLLAVAGCTASADEVRPPADQFFFPTGLALDPSESRLFVVNANSELRYDSGTVNVLNLAVVSSVIDDWTARRQAASGCAADPEQTETLVCDEEPFILADAGVRVGNFATGLALQATTAGARLILPVRGDPSITWIDWNKDSNRLACDDGSSGFAFCDDKHRLTSLRNNEELGLLPEEPFRVYAESATANGAEASYALVTHLDNGDVTLIDTRQDRSPVIADVARNVFFGTSSTVPGGTAIAGRPRGPSDPTDSPTLLYAVSRSEDRVQMMTVQPAVGNASPYLVPSNYFFLDAAGGNNGGSSDSRGLAFTKDGSRMLVANRRPPTLQVYDTTLDSNGFPRNTPVAVYDICREASGLTVADINGAAEGGELAVVTCFRDGTVYLIDAYGRRAADAIVRVGRGPFDVVISPVLQKAFITNFLEDSIGVIDLKPGSATQFREVLRIGETRQ